MSNPFVAEIRIVPFNFAPKGWAFCDGQVMPISQNTALFSLLGTTYGGNGTSNFALPNLQGCAPMQQGQGPGLSLRDLGETGGQQTVTVLQSELPSHSHSLSGNDSAGGQGPAGNVWSKPNQRGLAAYNADPGTKPAMSPFALSLTGGSQPHNNLMPYLTLNFIIALQGIFPPRS